MIERLPHKHIYDHEGEIEIISGIRRYTDLSPLELATKIAPLVTGRELAFGIFLALPPIFLLLNNKNQRRERLHDGVLPLIVV